MAAANKAASAEKLVKVVAVEPIGHGGVRHEPGTELEVPASAAKALLDAGAATLPVQAEEPPPPPPPPPAP
jgi:hypothetical protein